VWAQPARWASFGVGILPSGTLHEARERDYFFVLGFWAWGLCAGAGMTAISMALARRLPRAIAAMPFALARFRLLANRPVMDRHLEPVASLPRVVGRLMLESVPANGVLYTAGDNDSFPLWYLQQVEGIRSDVLVGHRAVARCALVPRHSWRVVMSCCRKVRSKAGRDWVRCCGHVGRAGEGAPACACERAAGRS
jgi:hypothetical protein